MFIIIISVFYYYHYYKYFAKFLCFPSTNNADFFSQLHLAEQIITGGHFNRWNNGYGRLQSHCRV